MSMQSLREDLVTELAGLSAELSVLDSLNELLPPLVAEAAYNVRRDGPELVLSLDGRRLGLKQALALLPPEKSYAAISGSFESPQELEIITEREMRENARYPLFWPAYPVFQVNSRVVGTYFVWRTSLRSSPIRLELRNADLADWEEVMSEGQLVTTGSSSVVLQPLLEPETTPLLTAHAVWNTKWDEFFESQGYGAAQLQFARAFKAAAANRTAVAAADLPQRAPATMSLAEQDLLILRTGESPEDWPAKSSVRGLARIGSFWGRFTQEQADRLLQFQQEMTASAPGPDSEYKEIMAVLEKAKQSLEQFNRDTFAAYRGKPPSALLSNYLQAEFGRPITVSYRDPVRGSISEYAQEIWIHLQRCNLGAKICYKGTFEKGDKLWFESPYARLKPVSFIS